MKKSFSVYPIVLAAMFICLFVGNCKKPERVIKIATLDVRSQDITRDTVIIKGEIIDIGDGALSNHGILLKKSDQAGDNFPTDLSLGSSGNEGVFSVKFPSPLPDTEYEYKAYAGNSSSTVYGQAKKFTTPALTLPELNTATVTEITINSARSGGNIISDGGSDITARGICWSTSENPTTDDNITDDPNPGTGVFINHLAWLTPNTTYYVRAYATNSLGTAYGNQVTFKTLAITQPVLTTAEVSEITNTTATSGGEITSNGNSDITAMGICWSTEENPTTDNEKSADPDPRTGEFVHQLINLTPNTIYYVRAYASNIDVTGYGNQVSFKSLAEQVNYITAGDGVTDIDGNTYASVIIGEQEWMAENLKTATYKVGTGISCGLSDYDWQTDVTGAYSLYPYSSVSDISTDMDMLDAYGHLYNWHAVDNPSGLCPDGWRMPAHDDWNQMVDYLIGNYDEIDASNTGVYLKSCRQPGSPLGGDCDTYNQPYWEPDNIYYGTDNFGFATLPGGYRSPEGDFYDLGGYGYWWSSTEDQGSYAFAHTMYCDAGEVNVASDDKAYGYSVRCIKETPSQNLATLTTTAVTDITVNTATSGGNITDDGGSAVTERGVCWSTSSNPTTSDSITTDGIGTGSYSSSLTALLSNTTYYVRAYATNSVGTAYGNEVSFTTNDAIVPSVTTVSVTGISDNSADCTGNVTDNGSSEANDRGFCYNTTGNPTITDNIVQNFDNGTGEFTETIGGLDPGTTYYVRAYGKNSEGTGYGDQIEFTTLSLPTITTEAVINIDYTTAESGGNITDNGGSAVTARGICWGTGPAPDLAGNYTTNGSGTGSYSSTMTGLDPGTTYYVKAYATNSAGTAYGQEETFTTISLSTPTVNTGNVYNITDVSATADGEVTDDGGGGITERGICYGTAASPTLSDNIVTVEGDLGSFSADLAGLTPGTTYYYRAYATNSEGTGYGEQIDFKTQSVPSLVTGTAYNITDVSATVEGGLTDNGGDNIIEYGICYNTSPNPTESDNTATVSGDIDNFSADLTGLTPSTTYYYRAYAINTIGAGYSDQLVFKTMSDIVTDIDGNNYFTIIIGEQEWMAENLRVTSYSDGTSIDHIINDADWAYTYTSNIGAYAVYPHEGIEELNSENDVLETFGALYNWYAVETAKLCPAGWHVPSDDEWTIMQDYLIENGYNYDNSVTTGDRLAKSLASTTGWEPSTIEGVPGNTDYPEKRNITGFSALPSGERDSDGDFLNYSITGRWWASSLSIGETYAYYFYIDYDDRSAHLSYIIKSKGYSVRCLKD